ncbi:MAG: ABC transporter substrate-binding protein [Sphingomonas sp.]
MKGPWPARRCGAGTALLAAALALAGCAHRAPQAPPSPLRVHGIKSVLELGPMLRAAETARGPVLVREGNILNLWKDEAPVAPGAQGESYGAMVAPSWPGHADLAGNAETQALRQSLIHSDLRIILTVTEGVYRIVARRSSGIARLEDLRGKRIATMPSTSGAFFLNRMLATAGLTEADVVIVPGMAKDGADALIAGRADAIAIWEPEPERAFAALGGDAVEIASGGIYRELYNLQSTAGTLADPVKRAQIVAYVRALIGACREATESPVRIQALMAESSGFDPALIRAAWHHHRFSCALPADLLDVLVAEEQWIAALDKRAPRPRAELAKLIDPSILAEALRPE